MSRRNIFAFRSLWYGAVFFVAAQVAIAGLVPREAVYDCRIKYDVFKDNIATLGVTIDEIKRQTESDGIEDYVILLGDSVSYSGPGGPRQSVSCFMDARAREQGLPRVFNLAIPAAQMGDFYTVLLMLEERGISTDRVAVNLVYAGFVSRDPDPPVVYWLERELRRLDPDAYASVSEDLERSAENKNRPGPVGAFLEYEVYPRVPVLRYKDFLRTWAEVRAGIRSEETGDPRPWTEKPYLEEVLQGPAYRRQFDPSPLALDDTNANVAFLRRIAEHQRGKNRRLLVYMSPVNVELMRDEVTDPGFARNMVLLNEFLQDIAVRYGFEYVDLSEALPASLFSDHLHLTADGYRALADILWDHLLTEVRSWAFTPPSS